MSLVVFGLIVVSACIHVGWNLLLKGATHRQLSSWLAVVVSGLVPLGWQWAQIGRDMWLIAALSALFQATYYLLLAYGYDHYDLGVLYPIARGSAPLFSAIWATIWLGDHLNLAGICAIICIAGGTIWVGIRNRDKHGKRAMPWLPIFVALAISGYTIIDAFGVRQSGNPAAYYAVCMTCTAVAMAPLTLWQQRPRLSDIVQALPRASIIGTLSFASYLIILWSYVSTPVSYVAATREISIIIAGLVGWLWLKEAFGAARTVGAIMMSIGVIILVLFG